MSTSQDIYRQISEVENLINSYLNNQENIYTVDDAVLKLFYPVGHRIIIKPKGITAKAHHENIIKQINDRLGESQEKIRLITNNYNRPDPEGYIKSFSKRIKKMDDGFFEKSYKKYCDFKHLNFVSPGTLTENIDEFTIDWFADLMTLIVGYLQKYKLNACII